MSAGEGDCTDVFLLLMLLLLLDTFLSTLLPRIASVTYEVE